MRANKIYYTLLSVFIAALLINPAMAADLFATAKTAIKDTAGQGSSIEMAIYAAGAIGAMLTGWITKNWVGGVSGFAVGMIFWSVVAPMVGL